MSETSSKEKLASLWAQLGKAWDNAKPISAKDDLNDEKDKGNDSDENSSDRTKEMENLAKKYLTRFGMANSSQLKLLDLVKKLEKTYNKASTLLTDFDKDPDMNLAWHEILPPLLFMSKLAQKVGETEPEEFVRMLMSEDKMEDAGTEALQVLLHYLDYADLAYDGDEDVSLTAFLDSYGYVEVFHSKQNDFEEPGFFMAFQPHKKRLLIGIKGTSSMGDVLTDVLCENAPFLENSTAHSGMMHGAEYVVKRIEPFVQHLFKPHGYSYTLVGHSLGAGIACLAGMKMKTEMGCHDLKVYAFGCPPVCDLNTALDAGYVTAVVNNRDIIPRVSLSNMRIMNKELAILKGLIEKGLTVDKVIENTHKAAEKRAADDIETRQKSASDLEPSEVTIKVLTDILREVSQNYKLEYNEDLYVPGNVYFLYDGSKAVNVVRGNGTMQSLRVFVLSISAIKEHMCDRYRETIHKAIADNGDSLRLDCLDIDSISAANIVCNHFRRFFVEEEKKEVTFYKITTSAILMGSTAVGEFSEKPKVAQFVAWRRYTNFENLKDAIKEQELGTVPSLPSKVFASPESRAEPFATFLKTLVSKALKRKNTFVLDLLVDFLGATKEYEVPAFIKAKLESERPSEEE